MREAKDKFQFPSRGFHLVADKIGEADYFLGKMKQESGACDEFRYLFSAFVSAARSVTFSLQAVMSKYPGFDEWYALRQQRLKDSRLVRFFVDVRNHLQKVGGVPVYFSGSMVEGRVEYFQEFGPTKEIPEVPSGDVVANSESYFRLLLDVINELYRDFAVYVDPREIFTPEGLNTLGWAIEDLEESLEFPKGWTDIDWSGEDKYEQRLKLLSRHGGDEVMEAFFYKYNIGSRFEPVEQL